jgi:hypothetical protein
MLQVMLLVLNQVNLTATPEPPELAVPDVVEAGAADGAVGGAVGVDAAGDVVGVEPGDLTATPGH